ncbi:A1pp-domain-containing protein [Lentinus tigrinus ALCF2SS1-7]|uniref:A1pp-domain-containing protein n=1 Tax=Lentinus tigrinus ALCF2SS1-6 TaxID=1328759 RepID=A0A5C2S9A9_9APHY|nr:A1pp-domain-containing protein [Lentinus tigrinus ALCF2SS1-6]RPD68427.1 A1pp-domain-containing protein [Lentinus tigrinus ALCF2SS1-7]
MSVALTKIPTIRELYKAGVLKAVDAAKHAPNPALLDRVSLYQGDITRLEVDSIVNAANRSLLGGGGVDGAIHAAAGPSLLEECRTLNGCDTGDAKITKGYDLPSLHVIHTVGPIYSSSNVEEKAQQLASCYQTSLQLAVKHSLKHIAFPSISTGIYGYPVKDATHIALDVVRKFLDTEDGTKLERTIFVVWSDADKAVYESLIPYYFPPERESKEESS